MISKELVKHLIEQACSGDKSAVAWLQKEHILPTSVCTASRTVEFEVWFPEDYILPNETVTK